MSLIPSLILIFKLLHLPIFCFLNAHTYKTGDHVQILSILCHHEPRQHPNDALCSLQCVPRKCALPQPIFQCLCHSGEYPLLSGVCDADDHFSYYLSVSGCNESFLGYVGGIFGIWAYSCSQPCAVHGWILKFCIWTFRMQ